jgi:hypothetical protein
MLKYKTKTFIVGAMCSIAMLLCATANATLIASENFDYTDGGLNGENGGSGWASAWTGNRLVENGETVGNNLTSFRQLADTIAHNDGDRVYISFDISADFVPANDFSGVSFYNDSSEELFFGMTFNTDAYGINWSGLSNGENGPTPSSMLDRLVGEIIFGAVNTTVNLFVNPTSSLTTPVDTNTFATSTLGGSWNTVRIAGNVSNRVDNLSIGSTLQDVMNVSAPTSVGLLIFATFALGAQGRRK